MAIKIRKFKNKDLFFVIDMLKEVVKNSADLTTIISSKKTESSSGAESEGVMEQIGLKILVSCYDAVRGPCINWFADLCGKSEEDFMELPPETSLDIITQIIESEDAKNFFMSAWSLSKKIGGLKSFTQKDSRQ